MKKQTKENTFRLNLTNITNTRALMIGFGAFAAATVMIASVLDGVDNVKTTTEIHKDAYGNTKLGREDKKDLAKDLAKDAFLAIVGFALTVSCVNAFRTLKRYNDDAAIRIARRYMIEMRKTNPVLKKYDYILNNEMALHNIAAGVANMMPFATTIEMGSDWDMLRYRSENTETKYDELKFKNVAIQSIIGDIRHVAKNNPEFMDKLVALVESSAKTFALDKYLANQKVR